MTSEEHLLREALKKAIKLLDDSAFLSSQMALGCEHCDPGNEGAELHFEHMGDINAFKNEFGYLIKK